MANFTEFDLPAGPVLEAALKAHAENAAGVALVAAAGTPTLEEKIDYLYTQAKAVEELIVMAGPLLAQAGPLLESLAPLLGKASSPAGRIFGAFL